MGDREFALKIFRDSTIDPTPVFIQKALGDLGYAPKIVGVFSLRGAPQNVKTDVRMSSGFCLLMELSKQGTLKTEIINRRKVSISQATYLQLIEDAKTISRIIEKLNILEGDLDAVITDSGHLQLIDVGQFRPVDRWNLPSPGPHGRAYYAFQSIKAFVDLATTAAPTER